MAKRSRTGRVVAVAMGGAVALLLGGAFLFEGSEVGCTEDRGEAGPGLVCVFTAAVHPAEIWTAFAGTGEPRPYYFDAVLQADLRPGGQWRFVTDDLERLLAGGELLVVEPRRRFAHTFEAADLDDPPSRVTVTLEPAAGGTRVELVHDRFGGETATYRRFRRAHPLALSAMKSFLETGRLPLRARLYSALFKPGMKLFTVRAEPWGSPGRGPRAVS
jgi:uncharacterized protein YndB with AHSA1/START domain